MCRPDPKPLLRWLKIVEYWGISLEDLHWWMNCGSHRTFRLLQFHCSRKVRVGSNPDLVGGSLWRAAPYPHGLRTASRKASNFLLKSIRSGSQLKWFALTLMACPGTIHRFEWLEWCDAG